MSGELADQISGWLAPMAKKEGADFDFYAWRQKSFHLSFEKLKLKKRGASESLDIRLRLLKGPQAGTSSAKSFSREAVEACFRQALQGLRLSDRQEAGEAGSPEAAQAIPSLYNPELAAFPLSEKIRLARSMARAAGAAGASQEASVQPVLNSVSDRELDTAFGSSQGGRGRSRRNGVWADSSSLAVKGEARALGFAERSGKSYRDIGFQALGREARARSAEKLGFSIPKTGRFPVVFKAGQAVSALLSFLLQHLNGRNVYEGMSLLKGSLGKKRFSKHFSLYDDPFAASWGLQSQPFDGEGFPSQKSALVEKGRVKSFLTCSFCAKALKAPHTAKASWGDEGRLGVSPTNAVMARGESSFEGLLEGFPKVIVIDWLKGLAGYNGASGDFSIESEGFLWEGGERKPLSRFAVSGNLIDLFSGILKTGNDSCVFQGRVQAPSFLSGPLSIAGEAG